MLYCSICGLRTGVIDQVHERDLLQVGEIQKFPAVLGCKAETVATGTLYGLQRIKS